jgi:DNA-binding transcriptional LysR family regulator
MSDPGYPSLDQLRVLAVVAETGSFSAAARRLHRTQSVISYTIAQLEAQLGLSLFERGGHRPALTEAGRTVLEAFTRAVSHRGAAPAHGGAQRRGAAGDGPRLWAGYQRLDG